MTASRTSTASHASNLSATACDPDSSQPTPTSAVFPSDQPERSSSSLAGDENSSEYDVKKDLDNPAEGWPRVALLMAKTPDFAAFSRFRDLNIKSLLYYQAQLTKLRVKLHEQEYDDCRSVHGKEAKFASRADILMGAEDSEQLKLIIQIRGLLKEYNEALLQYSQISELLEPDAYNMKSLRKWLRGQDDGNFKIGGNGEQSTWGYLYSEPDQEEFAPWRRFWKMIWALIWTQEPQQSNLDLVITRKPGKIDGFTRWVACYFIPYYEDFIQYRSCRNSVSDLEQQPKQKTSRWPKHTAKQPAIPVPENWLSKLKTEKTLATWSERSMLRFTSSVSTVVACLLPTVAVTVLSQVHGLRNLLLCIAAFAVLFAIGLIFLTNGTSSRVEIFTATAAFSAVLVVFISVPTIDISAPGVTVSS